MNPNFLDFEQPIADMEARIEELRHASDNQAVNIDEEVRRLREKLKLKTNEIFRNLTPWQTTQLSRHPARPYTNDYIRVMCEEFHELAGDRMYAEDAAIVGGLGRINGRSVMIIGHQKGRDTKTKVRRNFGMPRPEGYRKALRLMQMAERFKLPLITLIDTPRRLSRRGRGRARPERSHRPQPAGNGPIESTHHLHRDRRGRLRRRAGHRRG